jgi:DNA invertase Pin-like site-specific DNA recombinase
MRQIWGGLMLIGYSRTSTADQQYGLDAQDRDLLAEGCEKLFSEQVSSVAKREQLEAALEFSREGDVIVITKVDRMSRGVADLLGIIERLDKRGVGLRILSFGGGTFDTTNATSKLILTVLAATASWELSINKERQLEGVQRARAEGKYKGRQPTARAKTDEVAALHQQGNGAAAIAKELGISRASVYRILSNQPVEQA